MAAITLKQHNCGYIDRLGVGADWLDKQIDAVRTRYNATALQGARFFRTVKPSGGAYQETTLGTVLPLPVVDADANPMPFVAPVKGFKGSFTTTEYRSAVQAERRLTEEELGSYAKRSMSGLMNSARLLLEYQMANVFNQATSAVAAYQGADGVSLANDSHPQERRTTGTWDNLETASALTWGTFNTARTNMRKRTNEWGDPLVVLAKLLVVPADLEGQAKVVIQSEKIAGGVLNDKNVFQNSVEVMVYDYLTDTNAWMLFGDIPQEYSGLLYGPEVTPNIAPCEGSDKSTDIIWGERLRMIHFIGFTTDRNIQYNAGA